MIIMLIKVSNFKARFSLKSESDTIKDPTVSDPALTSACSRLQVLRIAMRLRWHSRYFSHRTNGIFCAILCWAGFSLISGDFSFFLEDLSILDSKKISFFPMDHMIFEPPPFLSLQSANLISISPFKPSIVLPTSLCWLLCSHLNFFSISKFR